MPLAPDLRLQYSEKFRKDYEGAPLEIQRTFDRKAEFLVANLRHPSLHAKSQDWVGDCAQSSSRQRRPAACEAPGATRGRVLSW